MLGRKAVELGAEGVGALALDLLAQRPPARVADSTAARRSSGCGVRMTRSFSARLAHTRDTIVGLRSSIFASSEAPIGPSRTIEKRTDVAVGVSSLPAVVERSRRDTRPIAVRRR